MNVHMVEIIFQKLHFVFLRLRPQLFVYYTAMPAKNPNHTPHPPMSSQKCIWCKQPKPLERFRINTGGVTRACEPCLEVDNAHAHANMLDNLTDTLASMTTLNQFYSKLKAAKEEETHASLSHSLTLLLSAKIILQLP